MDEVVWNVALGSAALGGTAAGSGGALNSLSSSWTPALDELVLKVDRKSKMRITHGRHWHVGTWCLPVIQKNYFGATSQGSRRVRTEQFQGA